MLNAAAPFPMVGSYSLHRSRLVRIQYRKGEDVLISLPGTYRASGNATVPLAELADPRPLDAAERAEMDALAAKLRRAGRRARPADRARLQALRERNIAARLLDEALRRAGLDRDAA